MRLTEFRSLIEAEFGGARGASMLADHTIFALGGRTGEQAIEAGMDPRDVWRALCAEFDVPRHRW